jgi:hypothetical protein
LLFSIYLGDRKAFCERAATCKRSQKGDFSWLTGVKVGYVNAFIDILHIMEAFVKQFCERLHKLCGVRGVMLCVDGSSSSVRSPLACSR